MTESHPTRDEVLGAFGDAFRLLVRHLDEHADWAGPAIWAQTYEREVVGEIRSTMEMHA